MSASSRKTVKSAGGWTDPAFARVAEVVRLVAGLEFPVNRQPSAEAGMRRAMSALRITDPYALARAIGTRGEARDAVLAELTIGESYFFREAGQLDVLRTTVLPTLEARDTSRPLRLWSAGCASGEEPYTLAILLRELGWVRPVRILGTDVATPRLDAARRARYTRWALRGVSDQRINRWFSRRGSHFQLSDEIRSTVEFAQLNLVADDYPSAATDTHEQDIVLCRNVLIYFDMPVVAQITTRLLAALAPEGWLICGASDPMLVGLVPCEGVMTPGGMAYRRADRPGRAVPVATVPVTPEGWATPSTSAGTPPLRHPVAATAGPTLLALPIPPEPPGDGYDGFQSDADAYAAADYVLAERLGRETLQREPAAPTWIRLVRSIANQGRLRDAESECARALDAHRLVAELHYLHATLLGAGGQVAEATRACRRALYLDRTFVMAHLQLGDTLARMGDRESARRAFANALESLAAMPLEAVVDGADGVPAARLRDIADQRLRGLTGGGA